MSIYSSIFFENGGGLVDFYNCLETSDNVYHLILLHILIGYSLKYYTI